MDGRYSQSRIGLQKIFLTEDQKKILTNHAEAEKPNESCALLYGSETNQGMIVERIFLTENIEKSPVNFTISAEQLLEADKIERESAQKMVGIFHSHPKSIAYPSDTDKKFMEVNPIIWLIYSGSTKEFKAFVLESRIREVKIEIK